MHPMIKARLQSATLSLAVLAFVWWYLGLHPVLGGSIAGVIVLSHLLPAKWDDIGSGIGFAILASVVYFFFHQERVAFLLGAVAAYYIFAGVRAFPRSTPEG